MARVSSIAQPVLELTGGLRDFEVPPSDDASLAALDDFVDRRVAEGGALPES